MVWGFQLPEARWHVDQLPPGFTNQHLPNAVGGTMFGVPVNEMPREELLAVIGFLVKNPDILRYSSPVIKTNTTS